MKVTRLEVKAFRNLSDISLEAHSGVNVIYGENGQGKTNLIEAMWLFTGSKAFAELHRQSLCRLAVKEPIFRLYFTMGQEKTVSE